MRYLTFTIWDGELRHLANGISRQRTWGEKSKMSDAVGRLQQVIDEYLSSGKKVKLLEAGCGSMSKVNLSRDVHITGIDISQKQLDRNARLNEKILGDIHTYPLPDRAFDLIICWDVLEHLEDPRKALENFFRACKPQGLIILAFPNLFSLKGIITKLMPYRVAIWYYKYLLGVKDAGKDDQPPFPTTLRLGMTYPAIRKLARRRNAHIEFFSFRESPDMKFVRRNFWIVNALLTSASLVSRFLTFGRIDAKNSDCVMVLRTSEGANSTSPRN
jgi:SAM-dependent methyltransferase